jgi:hypothetical protein
MNCREAIEMGAHLDETPQQAAARKAERARDMAFRRMLRSDPMLRLYGARLRARRNPGNAYWNQEYGALLQRIVSPVYLPRDFAQTEMRQAA